LGPVPCLTGAVFGSKTSWRISVAEKFEFAHLFSFRAVAMSLKPQRRGLRMAATMHSTEAGMAPFWKGYGEQSQKLMAFDYSQMARWRVQLTKQLDVQATVRAPGGGEVGAKFKMADWGHMRVQGSMGAIAPRAWLMAAHLHVDPVKTPGVMNGNSLHVAAGLAADGTPAVNISSGWRNDWLATTWRHRAGINGLSSRSTVSVTAGPVSVGGEFAVDTPSVLLPPFIVRDYNLGAEYRQPSYVLGARTRRRMEQLQLSACHTASVMSASGYPFEGRLDVGADLRSGLDGDRPVMAVGFRHTDVHAHRIKARLATDGTAELGCRLSADPSLSHRVEATGSWQAFGPRASAIPTKFGLALSVGDF
jgi:hypothetical protein